MERFFLQKNHNSTKRNYISRMIDDKVQCMKVAKKYGKDYWDGNRRYGYGGYRFIQGRLTPVAKKIIKQFNLNSKSKILDLGCGKGILLYEISNLLPGIKIQGLEISEHAIKNSPQNIKPSILKFDARKKLPFKNKEFDLALSFGLFHNFNLLELEKAISEFSRVAHKNYLMVESYRNNHELFNLQCWALTCETFLIPDEWRWMFKKANYKGDYEFIYFK
jgi:ubiquinone/menaquinone biosynthesis C-methylase UbiE